jgi:PAS domain S-box-containing protein
MSELSPLVDISAEANRVLHVDDDPDLADLTATFLERENDRFDVETATSASEGLDLLAETDFDCIISDYDMPGQNGIEFLETVREKYPDLPFILYTGKGSEEVASGAISAGVTDYLQKRAGSDQYTVLANRVSNAIDQYRSQQMIERSEQRLREIIDAVPHVLYVVDEEGTYLLANDALAEFHGMTVDEIEGETVETVLEESAADQFCEDLGDVIGSNTPKHISELEIDDPGGETHIFEPRLLPYESGETDTDAVLGVAVDVTERQRRECELERIRERMQLALDRTDSVLFEIDLDTGRVIRHGSFEQFFDHPPAEEPTWQDHLDEAVHPDDREQFRRFYQRLADGERDGGTLEYRMIPEEGRSRWIRDTVSVESDPSDGTAHALGIARDITKHKERELELQRKERRYQAVFNDPNILVGLIDTDGTVLDVNQTALEYIDASIDDVTDTPFWETPWFEHSETLQEEVRDWIDRAVGGEYVEFEANLVRPDGDPYAVEGVFRPVTNDDGEVVSLLISDRDVTVKKEHERELEETNAILSTLFETLPVGVIAEDASRNVLAVNERLFELFGLPGAPEEVIGADCERMAERVSDTFVDAEGFVERINYLVANREPTDDEELSLNDGRTFERSYRPIELPDGDGHLWTYSDITDRKERERRYDAIFNNTYQFTGLLEPDGTLIEANETALEFGGLDREDVIGKKMWEAYLFQHSEDTRERAHRAVERAADGEFVRHELPVQGADREAIIDFSVRPLTDEQGNVTLLIPEGRDITERKEREDRLRALNERTHHLVAADTCEQISQIGVEAASEVLGLEANAIHLYDDERAGLVPVAGTDAIYDLVGDPPVFAEGDSIAWRVYEQGETLALDDIHDDPDVYNPGTSVRSELYLPLGDHGILIAGSETPAAFDQQDVVFGELLADAVTAALAQAKRTDQLRAREQELEQTNTLLSTLFETLPVGVTVLDTDGTITRANQRAEEVLGVTESEIVERTYDDPEWRIIDADGDPIPADDLPFARVMETGETVLDYEHRIRWPDGTERWLSINATPLTTSNGAIEEVVAVITDITDQRNQEHALRQQNERLDQFASIASHDLRNPLNVAEGRLELAREECDSEHLDDIARAHERMNALIDDLLTLAREGETVGDTESVDLARLTENCWRNVATAEATLTTDVERSIQADRSRLQQLLENLVRNAVEHGGEDVTVTIGTLADGFYVEDDGPGIPEDEHDNVFEAGYSTAEDGTGFGLSIVKQVAEAHGWDVRVTDGSEGGARVEITGVEFTAE